MSEWYTRLLPYATAPAIVRSNQKDHYFMSEFEKKVGDLLRSVQGTRFVSAYGTEIGVLSKLVYMLVTTGVGARTLGEEYVDLSYVGRNGRRRVKLVQRLGFVLVYVLVPYLVSRLVKTVGAGREGIMKKVVNRLSFVNVLDVMNLHLALFYFGGQYYELSKRLFGLRYVFRYNPDSRSRQASGNYEVLGGLMLVQLAVKYVSLVKSVLARKDGEAKTEDATDTGRGLYRHPVKLDDNSSAIDLSDPLHLPYIPQQSRSCMLCLSEMVDPSAASCGHVFCWGCIVDWSREREECPLCRGPLKVSQLLPLR